MARLWVETGATCSGSSLLATAFTDSLLLCRRLARLGSAGRAAPAVVATGVAASMAPLWFCLGSERVTARTSNDL
jgi:hypothetical protein